MNKLQVELLVNQFPLLADLISLKPLSWFNPEITSFEEALPYVGLTAADVKLASERLLRFASFIERVFPETQISAGIIESPLQAIPEMKAALSVRYQTQLPGDLMVKLDSQLPISGSIKARGGIHEVLHHAESLALEAGILKLDDDYAKLDSDEFRDFFGQYKIAVGSTGNLGDRKSVV